MIILRYLGISYVESHGESICAIGVEKESDSIEEVCSIGESS